MSGILEFLEARLGEEAEENGCEGQPEYERCSVMSDRFLATIEAQRKIIEEYKEVRKVFLANPNLYVNGTLSSLVVVVRLLAEVYRDHEDWLEEWAA